MESELHVVPWNHKWYIPICQVWLKLYTWFRQGKHVNSLHLGQQQKQQQGLISKSNLHATWAFSSEKNTSFGFDLFLQDLSMLIFFYYYDWIRILSTSDPFKSQHYVYPHFINTVISCNDESLCLPKTNKRQSTGFVAQLTSNRVPVDFDLRLSHRVHSTSPSTEYDCAQDREALPALLITTINCSVRKKIIAVKNR